MALIDCPECSKPVSDSAPICPHCGFEIKKFTSREMDLFYPERFNTNEEVGSSTKGVGRRRSKRKATGRGKSKERKPVKTDLELKLLRLYFKVLFLFIILPFVFFVMATKFSILTLSAMLIWMFVIIGLIVNRESFCRFSVLLAMKPGKISDGILLVRSIVAVSLIMYSISILSHGYI